MSNANTYHVNFTYVSPIDDFLDSRGYNTDQNINIKFSLLEWEKKLAYNLQIVQRLSSVADNLVYIGASENGTNGAVEVLFDTCMDNTDLVKDGFISQLQDDVDPFINEVADETNQDRLKAVLNITATDPVKIILGDNSESDSESSESIINDEPHLQFLKKKLQTLDLYKSSSSSSSQSQDNDY